MKWINDKDCIKTYIVGFEKGENEERFHVHAFINLDKNRTRNQFTSVNIQGTIYNIDCKYLKTSKDITAVIRYVAKQRTKVFCRQLGKDLFIKDDVKGYIKSKLNTSTSTNKMRDDEIFEQYETEIRTKDWENIPQYFVFKNSKKITEYSNIMNNPQILETQPNCALIFNYGPPGTGKSSIARDFAIQLYGEYYEKPLTKWWDGYNYEQVVIINDITPMHFAMFQNELKIWADRYAFNAEVKGSTMKINPKWVIITSNYTLEELCSGDKMRFFEAAMRRRAGFGNRINYMGEAGGYIPKEIWKNAPEEQQTKYATVLQDYMARNSSVYHEQENPIATSYHVYSNKQNETPFTYIHMQT